MAAALPPAGQVNTGSGAIASDHSAAAGAGGAAATGANAIAIAGMKGGQIVIVQPPDGAGGLAEFVSRIRPPVRWPRRVPPRRLRTLVGRTDTARALDAAIAERAAIVVAGLEGAGKTTLLVDVLNGATAAGNADGVILLERSPESPAESADDLAQRIYDAVWDTGTPRRLVDVNTAQAGLAGITPIVAVDGAELSASEREVLARVLPQSSLIFVANTAPVGTALRILPVGPMPRTEAVRLLADRAGIKSADTSDALDHVAELLDDWPGALATIGDLVAAGRFELGRAIELLEAAKTGDAVPPARAYRRVVGVLRATLSPEELATLGAVAGLPGVSVREDVATAVAGAVPGGGVTPQAALPGLLASGLVRHNSPRLRMDGGLRAALQADTESDVTGTALAALASEGGILSPEVALNAEDATLGIALQRQAFERGDHKSALQLARALGPVLMSAGAWDAWKSVLDRAGQSAAALADENGQGWVANELGVRALGLRRTREARTHLRRASAIRRRIGDTAGVERTAQNLATLRLLPVLLGAAGIAGIGIGQVISLVAVVALTALALPMMFLFSFGAAPMGTVPPHSGAPSSLRASLAPSAGPTETAVIAQFEAVAEFTAGEVLRPNGDWTGTVTVTPTGGVGPYTFTYGLDFRTDVGAERFAIRGSRCAAVQVSISVAPKGGAAIELIDAYRPGECDNFNPPGRPGTGNATPVNDFNSDCPADVSVPFRFEVSLENDAAVAVTWSLEVERFDGRDWHLWWSALDSTYGVVLGLGCRAEYRWHAALTSADGWRGEWNDWSSITLLGG
jgi:hypothetical protein